MDNKQLQIWNVKQGNQCCKWNNLLIIYGGRRNYCGRKAEFGLALERDQVGKYFYDMW